MSAIKNERIIEAVQTYRCLYDARDPKYSDKQYKDKLWDKISEQINVPVKDCRIRWKSLRDRYRREKINEHRPSQIKWRYKPHMEFLAETLKPANPNIIYKEYGRSPRVVKVDEDHSGSDKGETTWQYSDGQEMFTNSVEQAISIENIEEVSWLPIDDPIVTTSPDKRNETYKNDNRRNTPLIHEVLLAMKRKYEQPPASEKHGKYTNFIAMMCEKMDKLTASESDDVQIEILQLLNRRINKET